MLGTLPFFIRAIAGFVFLSSSLSAALPVLVQPLPETKWVWLGDALSLSVSVTSDSAPLFQWYKDGRLLMGETGSTYTKSGMVTQDAGVYSVSVGNESGSVTSMTAAGVSFPQRPMLQQLPKRSVYPGSIFGVYAAELVGEYPSSGPYAVTYQWYKNDVLVPEMTGPNPVINRPIVASDRGFYSVTATNALGSASTTPVFLDILSSSLPLFPEIFIHPASLILIRDKQYQTSPFLLGLARSISMQFQWYKDGVAIPGADDIELRFTPGSFSPGPGNYFLEISNIYGRVRTATATVTVVATRGPGPKFSSHPSGQVAVAGGAVTLAAMATGDSNISYQWRKDGETIAGATAPILSLPNVRTRDSGPYTLLATDAFGVATSQPAPLRVTPSPFAGTYFGTFAAGGHWAMEVKEDARANLLGRLPDGTRVIIARDFAVLPSGEFSFGHPRGAALEGVGGVAEFVFTGEVSGTVVAGAVQGQLDGGRTVFSGAQVAPNAAFTGTQGYFEAASLARDGGEVAAIIGPDGRMLFILVDAVVIQGGLGTVNNAGQFSGDVVGGRFNGQLGAGQGFRGIYVPSNGSPVSFSAIGTGQLFNASTRGVSRGGEGVLTAGFVIVGSGPKDVLIRGVGPTLKDYDVPGWLPNPRLILYNQKGEVLAQNENWDQDAAAAVSAAMGRTGAAALKPGTLDSALHIRLQPGIYTAQVEANGSSGVALAEVYDDSPTSGSRLVNLSTRGTVGRGDDVMILGVNVNAAGARRLLIRAVGPGLKKHDVAGFLEDPKLELYSGQTKILENDNWGDAGSEVEAMSKQLGADELAIGSKDAALLVYLEHGSYTVHAKGVGDTTGIALIEVYEVP